MTTILTIIKANPDLSSYGWRYGANCNSCCNDAEQFERYRKDMHSPGFSGQVDTTVAWMLANPSKTLKLGSYGIKHQAETWGATNGMAPYVTNGAAICAALLLGYEIRRDWHDGPNCSFYMKRIPSPYHSIGKKAASLQK
jgi:hypothetical protein